MSKRSFMVVLATLMLSFTTVASAATGGRPSAPRAVKAQVSQSSVIVSFQAPVSNGGGRVLRYNVKILPTHQVRVCPSTRCVINGLHAGSSYSFAAAAVNRFGLGPYSAPSNKITIPMPLVSVTFEANGGQGIMSPESKPAKTSAPLTTNAFTSTGWTFDGWNTAADGSGASYTDGATFTFTTNTTLYAQWIVTLTPGLHPLLKLQHTAGYAAWENSAGYTGVQAQWNVPRLNCTGVPEGAVGVMIEAEGQGNDYAEIATTSRCVGGQQLNLLFYDTYSDTSTHTLASVTAGDVIKASLTEGSGGGWTYSAANLTRPATFTSTLTFSGVAQGIGWFVAQMWNSNANAEYALASFSPITFRNLSYTPQGGSFVSPPFSDAIEMLNSTNTPEVTPTPVLSSGGSPTFSVYYTATS